MQRRAVADILPASVVWRRDKVGFETPEFQLARWISADAKTLDDFVEANYSSCAADLDGDRVFMARNQFILDYTRERAPGIAFTDIKDVKDRVA